MKPTKTLNMQWASEIEVTQPAEPAPVKKFNRSLRRHPERCVRCKRRKVAVIADHPQTLCTVCIKTLYD